MNGEFTQLIEGFKALRVLVIGEAMLDSYLAGSAGRLCREAPVPVVNVDRRDDAPGGGANAACNAASLGAKVRFLSVVGADAEGEILRREMGARGVDPTDLLVEPGRVTLSKQRVIAGEQMLVRFDQGDTRAMSRATEEELLRRLPRAYGAADAIIVSDYSYGAITPRIQEALATLRRGHESTVVVDARRPGDYRPLRPTAAKPNFEEASQLLGEQAARRLRDSADAQIAADLLTRSGAECVALTLDSDGTLVIQAGQAPVRLPARRLAHPSTAGAGDTFVAALALALASGARPVDAAAVASSAARVVVGEDGTSACSPLELLEALSDERKLVTDRGRLAARAEQFRRQGKRIVFTNGCFDILHAGHIAYLNEARKLGDVLVVGLNADESVRRLKGPGRPVNQLADRAHVLAALDCVTCCVPFEEDTPAEIMRLLRPHVFAKGGDYTESTLPEAPLVYALGGEVRILPFVEDRSTTGIIQRIQATAGTVPSHQRARRGNGRQSMAPGSASPLRQA